MIFEVASKLRGFLENTCKNVHALQQDCIVENFECFRCVVQNICALFMQRTKCFASFSDPFLQKFVYEKESIKHFI